MIEENTYSIDNIRQAYNNNMLTIDHVRETIHILRSGGLLGEKIICEIRNKWKKKDSWMYFVDVLNPSNKLTYLKNPLNGENITIIFHLKQDLFKRGDLIVGEYNPKTSTQHLDKLIEIKPETITKLPKADDIKNLYGEKFWTYLQDKFTDDKELIPLIYENFEKINNEDIKNKLQEINNLNDKQNEILLEIEETKNKFKELENIINTKQLELHTLNKKISEFKEYFVDKSSLDNNSSNNTKNLIKAHNTEDAILKIWQSLYYYDNEFLVYKYDVISSLFKALKVDQLILLCGPSGTGKSSLVNQLGKIINKFKVHHVAVQSNWNEVQDLLGFFNPMQNKYISTPFLDALVEARLNPNEIHIICLDEMNLAHIEYYFSSFLSIREKNINERYIDLYSHRTFKTAKKDLEEILGENIESLIEQGVDIIEDKINSLKNDDRNLAMNNLELILYYPAKFIIPKNVRFIGTLNMDETVKPLSPKVIDRSFIIELKHTKDINEIIDGFKDDYVDGIIDIDIDDFIESANLEGSISDKSKILADEIINKSKILDIIPNVRLNGRGRKHIEQFIEVNHYDEDLITEQIICSKILPRIQFSKMDDEKLRAFNSFVNTLSPGDAREKAQEMLNNKRIVQFWG